MDMYKRGKKKKGGKENNGGSQPSQEWREGEESKHKPREMD